MGEYYDIGEYELIIVVVCWEYCCSIVVVCWESWECRVLHSEGVG